MVIDLNSFIGYWPTRPVQGSPDFVWENSRGYGATHIFCSHLESAWCRNPHHYNRDLYQVVKTAQDVWPVPVIDPTLATWEEELGRACQVDRVRMVRILPAYSQFELALGSRFFTAMSQSGLALLVQTRMEDPRRQHPLAQVDDVPVVDVAAIAERYPDLNVVIGGARSNEIRSLKEPLKNSRNIFADVSQADGLDAMKVLVDDGLGEKLVYGSHTPLFEVHSALFRVVADLDDLSAEAILSGNASKILGLVR